MIEITRRHELDMGHCLADHEGKCHRPHGHRYAVEATVSGPLVQAGSERGMVMDFASLSAALADMLGRYDHRFVIESIDPRAQACLNAFGHEGVLLMSVPPTAENLAQLWADELDASVGFEVTVRRVVVYETPNCRATWTP